MSSRARALPPELGDVFTPAQARAFGVGRARLRAGDLRAPFSGVRVVAGHEPVVLDDAPSARDRADRARIGALIRAYAPLMTAPSFICGRSALVWRGVSTPHGTELEIGVLEPERAPRRRGISSRMLTPHLVRLGVHEGIPITTPASAWAMLARELDVRELVRIGDQIVRIPRDEYGRSRPERRLATMEQLVHATDAGRRPGIGRLREALGLVRAGSMSPLETDTRLALVAARLPEPELDVEIRLPNGRLAGIADGAYRAQRVLLEVEGDHHRTSAAQWARDLEKHAAYAAAGWHLVRVSAAHVRGPHPRCVELVRSALARTTSAE